MLETRREATVADAFASTAAAAVDEELKSIGQSPSGFELLMSVALKNDIR